MNRAFTLVAPAFLAGFGVPIEASAAERIFSISDFQRIRVIGPFRVDVIADRLTTVRGKGSNDALDRVRLDVQGQTLFVRLDRTNFGGAEDKGPPAVITIRAPALREASLAGSGALSLTGMKGLRVGVVVEGSGSLSATNVQADRMDIGVVGTGTVTLSGKARNAIVTGRGAGSVKGSALSVDDLAVTWESAGDAALAAVRTAKVTSTGTGNVLVAGKPACTVSNGGNGQVTCGK
jgi:hypothetical protein